MTDAYTQKMLHLESKILMIEKRLLKLEQPSPQVMRVVNELRKIKHGKQIKTREMCKKIGCGTDTFKKACDFLEARGEIEKNKGYDIIGGGERIRTRVED